MCGWPEWSEAVRLGSGEMPAMADGSLSSDNRYGCSLAPVVFRS